MEDNKRKYIIREITREIVVISRCLNYIREVDFKNLDLQRNQHIFLIRIMENPGINQEDLSQLLRIDKTTTAKALKKLEEKGYVNRLKSKQDLRSLCIWPTEKTENIYPYILDSVNRTSQQGVEKFTDEEITQLHMLLQKYRKEITVQWENAKNKTI